jgi:hypothetical protein
LDGVGADAENRQGDLIDHAIPAGNRLFGDEDNIIVGETSLSDDGCERIGQIGMRIDIV